MLTLADLLAAVLPAGVTGLVLAAAVASMVVSSVVIVVLMITSGLYSNDPIIYGLLTSLVVYVGVSLLPARNEAPVAGVTAWARA